MTDVTIIGAGIVGICAALALQDDGHAVEIVDPELPEKAASFGNCALLAIGEIVPISKPGILSKIPGWLLDPASPLFVRPGALVSEAPWILRFLMSGRRRRVLEIATALAPLTRNAESDYRRLLDGLGLSDHLVDAENLIVFNDRQNYEADRFTWDLRRRHGFEYELLGLDDIRRLEPALGGPITCGVLLKGWLQFSDPGRMVQRLREAFLARGGRAVAGCVQRIETQGGKATAVLLGNGERLPVRRLVLAAGAWSGRLARDLGLRVPVAALQGYHHQLPRAGVRLNRAVLYANGGFVLTPLESGLRIAGTIEVAGLDPKPNYARADVIAGKARTILPGLDISGGTQWMGPRPFMPDTLPVIGPAPRFDNVVLAFGHGQIGMTLGPTTARLVADLVAQRRPALDLSPYRANRF
jgi:D-amino-acid dehydrogenase